MAAYSYKEVNDLFLAFPSNCIVYPVSSHNYICQCYAELTESKENCLCNFFCSSHRGRESISNKKGETSFFKRLNTCKLKKKTYIYNIYKSIYKICKKNII